MMRCHSAMMGRSNLMRGRSGTRKATFQHCKVSWFHGQSPTASFYASVRCRSQQKGCRLKGVG